MRTEAHSPLQEYINITFVQEPEWLAQARISGESLVPGMQISPSEGKLLAVLTTMIQAKNILEIGTFVGYSTLWMAGALPEDGHITTIEMKKEHAGYAASHFAASPYGKKCRLIEGKAVDIVKTLLDAVPRPVFDMIFIDAAKGEYAELLELTDPMLRQGGLMVGDNSLLFGHMIDQPKKPASASANISMQSFNEIIGKSGRFTGILLPTEEGLTIGVKKA